MGKPKECPAPKPDKATITIYENRIGNAMGSMRPRDVAKCVILLALGLFSAGCGHAQVKPTPPKVVDLTWNAPAACTGCTYVVSRVTLTPGASACPAVDYALVNYGPLNSASPVSALVYTDTAASGILACYIVQAIDTTNRTSSASNIAGPFTVPTVLGAPTIAGAVAETQEPALPLPNASTAPRLVGKVH